MCLRRRTTQLQAQGAQEPLPTPRHPTYKPKVMAEGLEQEPYAAKEGAPAQPPRGPQGRQPTRTCTAHLSTSPTLHRCPLELVPINSPVPSPPRHCQSCEAKSSSDIPKYSETFGATPRSPRATPKAGQRPQCRSCPNFLRSQTPTAGPRIPAWEAPTQTRVRPGPPYTSVGAQHADRSPSQTPGPRPCHTQTPTAVFPALTPSAP